MRLAALVLASAAALAPAKTAVDQSALGIGYICGAERVAAANGPRSLAMTPGIGNSHMAIAATPEAQRWFDYGLQLADGFYHEDAKLAFAKASSLDPACAICRLGEAWAHGPTLNFDVPEAEMKASLAFVEQAEALAKAASPRDRDLIAAMKVRYSPAPKDTTAALAFGKAMDELYRKYPDEPEIGVMAAQALLIPGRGGDAWGVERSVAILDGILRKDPDNAAAIHFYIHATEFVGRASLALPYARRLPALAPSASHMVHMPGHTLFRVGRYEDAALLNARALGVEASYRKALNAPGPLGTAGYYAHNFQFGLAGAMMAGDRPLALKFAAHAKVAYPEGVTANQREFVLGRSYAALGRFDPDAALAIPEPGKDKIVLAIMRHYARGEALAARGDAAGMHTEIDALRELKAAGPTVDARDLARLVLEGRAAMLAGDSEGAVRAYAEAAERQDDKLRGLMDPPPWWYPVRRSLAAALLVQGRYQDAAMEAQRSLTDWPQDALALKVLSEAEGRLGRKAEAQRHIAEARKAYLGDVAAVPLARI